MVLSLSLGFNYYQGPTTQTGTSRLTRGYSCGGGGQAAVLGPGPALELPKPRYADDSGALDRLRRWTESEEAA
jgi:hypothetical protein